MFMFVLSNQIRFDFLKYGEDSIIKESAIEIRQFYDWGALETYEISQTELSLQDLAIDLDKVTELQDSSVFRLKQG